MKIPESVLQRTKQPRQQLAHERVADQSFAQPTGIGRTQLPTMGRGATDLYEAAQQQHQHPYWPPVRIRK